MNSKNKLKKAKKRLKDLGIAGRLKYAHVICIVCGNEFAVRTNNIELYTDEIKKNWKCLNCKNKGRL